MNWHNWDNMALKESDLQRAFVSWAKTQIKDHPELLWLHAVPNGGFRDGKEAVGLQSQGVKAGILDMSLDVARGGFHGWKAELKIPGGKCKAPSKEQAEYISFCHEQGYCTIVTNEFDVLKSHILDYLEGRLIRVDA